MIFLKMSIMKRLFSSVFWGAFIFSALWSQKVCANGGIIYVDADANGLNNGTSWTDAYKELELAILNSVVGNELWVAQGTYRPTIVDNFNMKASVAIYGGFAGNETSREQRDWINNETILMPSSGGSSSTKHVIIGANNATLDGFTITGGNYTEGGGMYNYQTSPIVTNCKFTGNTAGTSGGGMYNYQSNPKINNCTFVENSGEEGGGIYNNNSSAEITGCTFIGNIAGPGGGGIYNVQSNVIIMKCQFINNESMQGSGLLNFYESQSIVYDCTFERNISLPDDSILGNFNSSPKIINCKFIDHLNGDGSGMLNRTTSNPILINCIFIGKWQEESPDVAMFNVDRSSPTIINCTFFNNSSIYGVCILNLDNGNPILSNCILWGKSLTIGPLIANYNSITQVTYSNISGGWTGEGNINQNPLFLDSDNGDFRLMADSPCIDTGDNNSVPADSLDLDGDGNTTEKIPFDLAGRQRIRDGNCDGQTVADMGAYEFYLIGDLKIDCRVNFPDIAVFANNWLQTNCIPVNNWCSGSDTDRDGDADFADLSEITSHWLEESL